jgi:hypothetical protein
MEPKEFVQTVISILTTLITGGFIIVLMDVKNRQSRAFEKFREFKSAFSDKLSAYCRFVVWYEPVIYYYDAGLDYVQQLKKSIDFVKKKGTQIITQNDLSWVMNLEEFKEFTQNVSAIWYEYEKMQVAHMAQNRTSLKSNQRFIEKELSLFAPDYLTHINDHSLIADVSSDFLQDICEKYYNELQDYHIKESMYMRMNKVILAMIVVVIVLIISLMMTITTCCLLPYVSLFIVAFMFVSAVILMSLDETKLMSYYSKLYPYRPKKK